MIKRNDILKVMSIIPIIFFRKFNLLLPGSGTTFPIAEFFLQSIFSGNTLRRETDAMVVMYGLLEVTIFNLLFGAYLYQDLYENSIYIFIRQKSRSGWFARKTAELFCFSMGYVFLWIGSTFLLCVLHTGQSADAATIRVFVVTYVVVTLYSFWTTLLINVIAVFTGATASFIIYYIISGILSVLAINFEDTPIISRFPVLLRLNPIANVTVNWNEGLGKGMMPAVYFVVLCAFTYIIGNILINKMDISIKNKE